MNKKLEEMGVSQKLRFGEELGMQVAKMLNSATRRANKLLKAYGYEITVEAQFREIESEEE